MEFKLTDKQKEHIHRWQIAHASNCDRPIPALGEHWAYVFIPSGLGNIVKVRCVLCGEELDVTDTDSW